MALLPSLAAKYCKKHNSTQKLIKSWLQCIKRRVEGEIMSTSGMLESHQPISKEANFINWTLWKGVRPGVETEVPPVLGSPPSAGALTSEERRKKKGRGLGVTAAPLISHPGRQSDSRLTARLHIHLPWDKRVHVMAGNMRFGATQQRHPLPFPMLNPGFPLSLKYLTPFHTFVMETALELLTYTFSSSHSRLSVLVAWLKCLTTCTQIECQHISLTHFLFLYNLQAKYWRNSWGFFFCVFLKQVEKSYSYNHLISSL